MKRDVIVVGASAGGVGALEHLCESLPSELAATVLIVLHIPLTGSLLPEILQRKTSLSVRHAKGGDRLEHRTILVAPPGLHLVLADESSVQAIRGPRVNGHCPAIDPLFYSAAQHCGARVIGVLLSGLGDDGASGFAALKRVGAKLVAQDPAQAPFKDMPRHGIEAAKVDHVVGAEAMGSLLAELVATEVDANVARPLFDELTREANPSLNDADVFTDEGTPSPFSCPHCKGVLWERSDNGLLRYRCRVGHVFAPHALEEANREALEEALWTAFRALKEREALAKRLADHANAQGLTTSKRVFDLRAAASAKRASIIRHALEEPEPLIHSSEGDEET